MSIDPKIVPTPKVEIDPAAKNLVQEERQVILRVSYGAWMKVRIWPTTYLICNQSGKRSIL